MFLYLFVGVMVQSFRIIEHQDFNLLAFALMQTETNIFFVLIFLFDNFSISPYHYLVGTTAIHYTFPCTSHLKQ